jgi:hypothetical protein
LHFGVTEHDGAEHDFFGQLVGFRLNHQHGGFGTGNHEVKLATLELAQGRAQNVLAIDVTDASSTDRAVERHAGDSQSSRGANHRRNVGIDFRIQRHHGGDDLNFVVEAIREQRANRAVDQAAGQRFFFGRTAFTLEEAAGDAAGSVGFSW